MQRDDGDGGLRSGEIVLGGCVYVADNRANMPVRIVVVLV